MKCFNVGPYGVIFYKSKGEPVVGIAAEFFKLQSYVDRLEGELTKKIEDILAIRWNSETLKSTPEYEDMEFYASDKTVIIAEMDDWWDLPKSALPALKELGLKKIEVHFKGDKEEVEYDLS